MNSNTAEKIIISLNHALIQALDYTARLYADNQSKYDTANDSIKAYYNNFDNKVSRIKAEQEKLKQELEDCYIKDDTLRIDLAQAIISDDADEIKKIQSNITEHNFNKFNLQESIKLLNPDYVQADESAYLKADSDIKSFYAEQDYMYSELDAIAGYLKHAAEAITKLSCGSTVYLDNWGVKGVGPQIDQAAYNIQQHFAAHSNN